MKEEIAVSVLCATYNQENYIRSALEGFVMQQTNFKFEVLVQDDASTDGTADIIREYEKKYPTLIKGVYQIENQYSQGKSPFRILTSIAKGELIALCEGDDYWIDPLKLQKQYDALKARPDVDVCGHSAIKSRKGRAVGLLKPGSDDCVLPVGFFIAGGSVPTASLMMKRRCFTRETGVDSYLDFFFRIQSSIPNGMLYLKDVMSVYRIGADGSWNAHMKKAKQKRYSYRESVVMRNLSILNRATNFVYDAEIKKKLRSCECEQLLDLGEYKRALKEYGDVLKEFPRGIRQNVKVSAFSPVLGVLFVFFKNCTRAVLAPYLYWKQNRKYQYLIKYRN